jgi:hypothetical protein
MSRTRIVILLALLGVAVPAAVVLTIGGRHFMMPAPVHFGLVSTAAAERGPATAAAS